jgi:hypothetical protein
MIEHNRSKRVDFPSVPLLLILCFTVFLMFPIQSIHDLTELYAYNYAKSKVEKVLSDGGQVCPLESQSECKNQNQSQTDIHNMSQNVPSQGKLDIGQDSNATSITDTSNKSQNETNLANITTLNGDIKNPSQDMINITTDKQIYNTGEKVSITIKNMGSEQLTFPNSALGITIRNLASNELYPILSSQVITILNPGGSKSLVWDQIGLDGNQAPSGKYMASVNSGIITAQTTFSIR